jgi:hypothetical protein
MTFGYYPAASGLARKLQILLRRLREGFEREESIMPPLEAINFFVVSIAFLLYRL